MPSDSERPIRPPNAFDKANQIKCKFCQKLFTPRRKWQLFCSPIHRTAYWNIQYILERGTDEDKRH